MITRPSLYPDSISHFMKYVIASITSKHFVTFLKTKPGNNWEFGDLDKASRFTKIAATKMSKNVMLYLAYETNYVGDIKVMAIDKAEQLISTQKSEIMTIDKMHSRWCPSLICDANDCRFTTDLQSLCNNLPK